MLSRIKKLLPSDFKYGSIAFFLPVFIMASVYLSLSIYPGSERTVLASDAFSQFSNFHASFNNVLHGKQSLLFTWNASLGLNYLSLVSYYLGGIFTPLVFFFKNSQMPDALYFLTLLKVGCAGLSFWYFSRETYKLNHWAHVTLAIPYALCSYAMAQSEIIMWLDTFVFLPLIILGIDRILKGQKPALLFISYFIFFISNFYMAFMVGVFSFLYYCVRLFLNFKQNKKTIVPYLFTAFSAGIASMVMILPAIIDLRTNGEELSKITRLKTEATGFWDLIMKNMIGVYDTTKYGSIPFIYAGLLPLIFCLFYFVTKKVPLKNKIGFGSLLALLIASFYFQPLNLFWQGMHAPNMFLFRFSFLFSFLVVLLAGYGWEKFHQDDLGYLAGTIIILIALVTTGSALAGKNYDYVTTENFYATVLFLALYLIGIIFYQLKHIDWGKLSVLLLLLVCLEACINTSGMLHGVLEDWNYPSRSLYTEPYPAIKNLVDKATTAEAGANYRLENYDAVSSNDGLNYGYSGISMFSSIRNRNSSSLLNTFGFRSRGTNLNIRYANNTLLADALFGIKYNLSKNNVQKYGFSQVAESGAYQSYQNQNALPLGIFTDSGINQLELPANDNLGTQTLVYNYLAENDYTYFTFQQPEMISHNNVEITQQGSNVTYSEVEGNIAKEITWKVSVPAGKQAYLSLFPSDYNLLSSSTATVTVNGIQQKSQINITGQYYNLGYYTQATDVIFTVSFYGSEKVAFVDPTVMMMDLTSFQEATDAIKEKAVDFKLGKRSAEATVNFKTNGQVFTTIPYDESWSAYVDGKKVEITAFQDGFLTFPITSGQHDIRLVFFPKGLKLGIVCFISGTTAFLIYMYYDPKKPFKKTGKWRKNTTSQPE